MAVVTMDKLASLSLPADAQSTIQPTKQKVNKIKELP